MCSEICSQDRKNFTEVIQKVYRKSYDIGIWKQYYSKEHTKSMHSVYNITQRRQPQNVIRNLAIRNLITVSLNLLYATKEMHTLRNEQIIIKTV